MATVAGLLGFVLSVPPAAAGGSGTTATLNWLQGGQLNNVTAPLISLTPVSVTATIPCDVIRSMPPKGAWCSAWHRRRQATPHHPLFVTVNATRVDVTDRNVVVASVPAVPGAGPGLPTHRDHLSSEEGTFASFIGVPPDTTVEDDEGFAQKATTTAAGLRDPEPPSGDRQSGCSPT